MGETNSSFKVSLNESFRSGNLLEWFVRLLKGVLIGIGAILPGLSGGVLAVVFNVYEPLVSFLANIFNKFWKNVFFFLPIGTRHAVLSG